MQTKWGGLLGASLGLFTFSLIKANSADKLYTLRFYLFRRKKAIIYLIKSDVKILTFHFQF